MFRIRGGHRSLKRESLRRLRLDPLERRQMLSATPELVADVNVSTGPSAPSDHVSLGGVTYFVADDGVHGRELWRTDGTESGTSLVADLAPGAETLSPRYLTVVDGTLFFTASTIASGELWKSDGSAAGTLLVRQIANAPSASPMQLQAIGDRLLFKADDGVHGIELWVSDGTSAGTHVVDFYAGPSGTTPGAVTEFDGALYFSGRVPVGSSSQTKLLRSDLGLNGVSVVSDVRPSSPLQFGDTLYFLGRDPAAPDGAEIWTTDGTSAGTRPLTNAFDDGEGADYWSISQIGGSLVFLGRDAENGLAVWNLDLATEQLARVTSINPDPQALSGIRTAQVGGSVFFVADDGVSGMELWRTDGTEAGTARVADIRPGSGSGVAQAANLVEGSPGKLFFTANDGVHGKELWQSDGTAGGTSLFRDFFPGPAASNAYPVAVDDQLFVVADDGLTGVEPWTTDGTAQGSEQVVDVNATSAGSAAQAFTPVGDAMFYFANDGASGLEPWITDESGSRRVADVFPGPQSSYALASDIRTVAFQGQFYFTADDGLHGQELWKSDGTESGTQMLLDISAGSASSSPTKFAAADGLLYFSASDPEAGRELWVTDGTTAGTRRVIDLRPGTQSGLGSQLAVVGGKGVFAGSDGASGSELWISDGTASGTQLVDLTTSAGGSSPDRFVTFGDKLLFQARLSFTNYAIWQTDGTPAGTQSLVSVGTTALRALQVSGSHFYYIRGQGADELWSSDGLPGGERKLLSVDYSRLDQLTPVGERLYFVRSGDTQYELWVTDGTLGGTREAATLPRQGFTDHGPLDLTAVGSVLYFTAEREGAGRELWSSRGTPATTQLVADLNPGWRDGLLEDAVYRKPAIEAFGDGAWFTAEDGVSGQEPFRLVPPADNQAPLADAGDGYSVAEGQVLTLDGSGSFDPDGDADLLTLEWDLDGDGQFGEVGTSAERGDEAGEHPVYRATGLDGPGTFQVTLRAWDLGSATPSVATADIALANAPPSALQLVGRTPIVGLPRSFALDVHDPSAVDQAAAFSYAIDWDNDGAIDQQLSGPAGLSVVHTFAAAGAHHPRVTVSDRDGGTSSFSINLYVALPGDANLDGRVSGADYTVWADHFNKHNGDARPEDGDFNDDGFVTGADLAVWLNHFNQQVDGEAIALPSRLRVDLAAPLPAAIAKPRAASRSQILAVDALLERWIWQRFDGY